MTTQPTPTAAPSAADVLGVPLLPPPAVTVSANRVRFALRRLHAAMAPPPVRILEGLFGMLDHRVLVALCEAGVPDALTRPVELAALAERIGADPTMLERLLRFASTRGWVRIDRRRRGSAVCPDRGDRCLRRGQRGAVLRMDGRPSRPLVHLRSGDGRRRADARPDPGRCPRLGGHQHRLRRGRRHRSAARHLVDLVPDLEGTVLDLPDVVDRAPHHPRLKVVAGDAFTHVPGGFDAYLLVNVLHDWNDEDATRLLRRVAEAAAGRSRVVVVDSDRPTVPDDGVAVSADVLMAALTAGGKERDTAAFTTLGRVAGLRLERSVRLASGDLAHVFRPR